MRIVRVGVAALVACLVVVALWVGQWRYFQYSRELVRVNRFSGNAFRLTHDGWERMQPESPVAAYQRQYAAPAVMDTGFNMDTTTPPKSAH